MWTRAAPSSIMSQETSTTTSTKCGQNLVSTIIVSTLAPSRGWISTLQPTLHQINVQDIQGHRVRNFQRLRQIQSKYQNPDFYKNNTFGLRLQAWMHLCCWMITLWLSSTQRNYRPQASLSRMHWSRCQPIFHRGKIQSNGPSQSLSMPIPFWMRS